MGDNDSGNDPEETMPFTHRPWGSQEPDQPWTSPSGSPSSPSGPGYMPPPVPPPTPSSSPPPPSAQPPYSQPPHAYGPPPSTPWGGAPAPYAHPGAYGPYGVGGVHDHAGADQARTLGIIGLISIPFAFFCCVGIVGLFCAPVAWVKASNALKEIDANPQAYRNRSTATAAMTMGIIGTIVGGLALISVVALGALAFVPA